MKIAWINSFDEAIIEAGNQVSNLPIQNLQNSQVAVKWQTQSGINSTYFLADLTSIVAVSCIALIGTNLTSTATVRIRGSNTDSSAVAGEIVDTGVLSGVVSDNYRNFYRAFTTPYSARYWRIDIEDTSLNYLRMGRAFIGPAWSPSKEMNFGWTIGYTDASRITRSQGGQLYIDESFQFRALDFTLSFMDQAEMINNGFELTRRNGGVRDVLVMPDENGTFNSELSIFGLVSGASPLTHVTYQIYRIRYRVEERL